ncbi:MAG: translation elongation factor Ts [Fimbriimonadaceae bacterium]|nr:translation elongation factor Ts [Fimbriimonadaceae bacterium]
MAVSAADVKRLREDTDAPMMECKAALDEAGGDYEKAKAILREKGKAAAAKRADRSTAAGVVAIAMAHDHKSLGAVVLESETDFVARNEDFIAIAQELAEIFLHNDPGSDALAIKHGEKSVGEIVEGAVATIRENIKLSKALHMKTDGQFVSYVHHDRTKGSVIEFSGNEAGRQAARDVAIQVVAFPPDVVSKDQLDQAKIDAEIAVETQRAVNEGKPENIAKNIAQGRVNKEFIKRAVLLEQEFYKDPSKSVSAFLAEESKGAAAPIELKAFVYLRVGGE